MENVSAVRSLQRRIKPLTGRKGGKTRQPVERSLGFDCYAFLRQEFKPFYGVESSDLKRTEREFFASLVNLCQLYGWAMPDVSGLNFPENICFAYQCIKEVAEKERVSVLIVVNDAGVTTLATVKTLGLYGDLYYIPVRPYWYISKKKELEQLFKVVTCIFSYLHKVIGVPYFRGYCYMRDIYEMLENMLIDQYDEDAEDELQEQKQTLEDIEYYGDELYPVFNVGYEAKVLKALLEDGQGLSAEVLDLAWDFLKLSLDYPNRSLDTSLNYDLLGKVENGVIDTDRYLSFYWSGYDCFHYEIEEWVNNDCMDMDGINEPVAVQCFDKPQEVVRYDFDFETRLFSYLDRLVFILNSYDHEER